MIRRTLDARFLNTMANHPEVRPLIGGEGALDLTAVIADPGNIALTTPHGGWVLIRHEAGTYELHTLFLKAGRGRGYFKAAGEALRYVFTATDAREIVTRVPAHNRGAARAAAWCGFQERFTRLNAWRSVDGTSHAVSYQALSLDRWMATADGLLEHGRWFHEELETGLAGAGPPEHPADEAHDRAVGASVLMIRAGNARKGVWAYNRWARLAGYPPITLLNDAPVIIDVGAGVTLEAREGRMEVIACP